MALPHPDKTIKSYYYLAATLVMCRWPLQLAERTLMQPLIMQTSIGMLHARFLSALMATATCGEVTDASLDCVHVRLDFPQLLSELMLHIVTIGIEIFDLIFDTPNFVDQWRKDPFQFSCRGSHQRFLKHPEPYCSQSPPLPANY